MKTKNCQIKRALISVSDKSNLEQLVLALYKRGVEIISTGGTAAKIKGMGVPVTPIEQVTGNPEVMDGRVKTLSFQISAALLSRLEHQTE